MNRLKQLRTDRDMSLRALADKTGIDTILRSTGTDSKITASGKSSHGSPAGTLHLSLLAI